MSKPPERVPLERPLRSDEIELIEWLLTHARTLDDEVLTDWSSYRVISGCACGCGTLELAMPGCSTAESTHRVIASAAGASPEGHKINVFLHTESGVVTELEIMPVEAEPPFSLPRPEHLSPWPRQVRDA